MKWRIAVAVLAILLAPYAWAAAQDQPDGTLTGSTTASRQQEALQRGTALFIITLISLLIFVLAVIIISITLRRSMASVQPKEFKPTDAESLWWKSGGPNPPDDRKKQ